MSAPATETPVPDAVLPRKHSESESRAVTASLAQTPLVAHAPIGAGFPVPEQCARNPPARHPRSGSVVARDRCRFRATRDAANVFHRQRSRIRSRADRSCLPANQDNSAAGGISAIFPSASARDEETRLAVQCARQTFDLSAGPLFRTCLLRLGDQELLLVLVIHHIISDRWSVGILLRELGSFYRDSAANAALPPIAFAHSDFSNWQLKQQSEPGVLDHLRHWRELLIDAPPLLDLPTDHARPSTITFEGAVHATSIEPDLAARIRSVGIAQGATPFMTFLTAFLVLLHRVTQQADILIGTAAAGRNRLETEQLIGCFVNLLPVRTQLRRDKSFNENLAPVRSTILDLLAHQESPFERIVEAVSRDRDPSHQPLFDVVFSFHNVPPALAWEGDLRAELEEIRVGISRYDLTLTIRPSPGGGMSCEFEYSRELFEDSTIARLAGQFLILLQGIANDPACPISKLPILEPAERLLILEQWSGRTAKVAATHCIHELFERQSALAPNKDAVVCGHDRLTYAQLNTRVNQLAWRLRSAGVGPEKLVAICLRRTAELPIAILAVLKAGGAYVPLDPLYPPMRLAHILEVARPVVLLTQRDLSERFAPEAGRTLIMVDEAPLADIERDDNPPGVVDLSNLAYVIFTSGSTGRPKGVAIEHRGPAILVEWSKQVFGEAESAGMLCSMSVCFDFSVFELFVPLARGAKVILVPNVLELPEAPAAEEVTFVSGVPSAITELIRMGGVPASARAICLGGEAIPASLARQCHELPQICAVYNVYGATEDTVFSTFYTVPKSSTGTPSVGWPGAGSHMYILDSDLQPSPVGAVGELYLGGGTLARCYLNRDDLTRERFLPNPFHPGERLYRTGDLGRWNADGSIHYLGRLDHQVKLRGFRIELGEIETVLGAHRSVSQCRVIVRGEASDRRLVAYVVPNASGPEPVEKLRDHLRNHLPAYMIPSAFVFLDVMPITPNGKLDTAALPAPDSGARDGSISNTLHGDVQRKLAKIWCEVLKIAAVGAEDDFFALGGHSLQLVTVATRAQRQFGVEFPLRQYFERPTIAAIAELMQRRPEQASVPFATTGHDPADGRDSMSAGQQRLWFLEKLEGAGGTYNISIAQRLIGPLDLPRLEQCISVVCDRHESLRTIFPEDDGMPRQVILPPKQNRIVFRVAELGDAPSAELDESIRRLIRENRRQTFDLEQWPLFRVLIIRVAEREHVFAICLHHIICDDWSLRLLFGEIAALYGEDSRPLSPLDWQYRDFARWQRQSLQEGKMRRQLAYWRDQLRAAPAALPMPVDRKRPALQTFSGWREQVTVPYSANAAIHALSQSENTSTFITFLATFSLLLARWTRQQDIIVGTRRSRIAPVWRRMRLSAFCSTRWRSDRI